MTENQTPRKYYPFLDALRGIALLWVIAHHSNYYFKMDTYNPKPFWQAMGTFFTAGFMGVDLFFVTSGFLITGLLMDEFYHGKVNVTRFYKRRFFKIIPHYFLIVVIAFGLMAIYSPKFVMYPLEIFGCLTLTQNYLKDTVPLLDHTWSIAIEEHFYIIYPLILFYVGGLFKGKKGRHKSILFVLFFLLILGNISRIIFFKGADELDIYYYQKTHLRFDALIFGCFLRFAEEWLVRLGKKKFSGVLFFIAAVLIYSFLVLKAQHTIWFHTTLMYLAAGFILCAALCGFKPLLEVGENRFLKFIGKNCYGIYLWHYPLIFLIYQIFQSVRIYESLPMVIPPSIVIIHLILSVALGVLSTVTLEKYFLKLRQTWIP